VEIGVGTLAASNNPAEAEAFLEFLTTEQAEVVLRRHNYRVEPPGIL
jgi:ABC-type Fe3+ transport system substrate-binding protein